MRGFTDLFVVVGSSVELEWLESSGRDLKRELGYSGEIS